MCMWFYVFQFVLFFLSGLINILYGWVAMWECMTSDNKWGLCAWTWTTNLIKKIIIMFRNVWNGTKFALFGVGYNNFNVRRIYFWKIEVRFKKKYINYVLFFSVFLSFAFEKMFIIVFITIKMSVILYLFGKMLFLKNGFILLYIYIYIHAYTHK